MLVYDAAYFATFVGFLVAVFSLAKAYLKGWRPKFRKEHATQGPVP